MKEVVAAFCALLERGAGGALATVVKTSGSTPQVPGARLLLWPDGRTTGTVGGGALEQKVIAALKACEEPKLIAVDLTRDLGMCCGGRIEIFIEPIAGPSRLVIFGAGHVAQAVAAAAQPVGFQVTIVDDREELATEARFPGCRRILSSSAEAASSVDATEKDFFLLATHDHRLDEAALEMCLARPHRYIGLLGSRRKVIRALARLKFRHGSLPALDRVYAPVGLVLGAVTPQEIALSIVAELVALRRGARAKHMRIIDEPRFRERLSSAPEQLLLLSEEDP